MLIAVGCLGAALGLAFYLFFWLSKSRYWANANVTHVPYVFPFGSINDVVFMRKTTGEAMRDIYRDFSGEPAVGVHAPVAPALLLRHPDLVKAVLVKEFNSFHDNGFQVSIKVDPLFGINPFVSNGPKWREIRGVHTSSHTVSKLKQMIPDLAKAGRNMVEYIEQLEGADVEAKEICGWYTLDAVAAVAFGLEAKAFLGPNEGFRKHTSGEIFSNSSENNIAAICAVFWPKFAEYLGLRILSKKVERFFVEMVKHTKKHRRETGVQRNDLFQHLIDHTMPDGRPGFTDVEIAGHCMTFFLDGTETSSLLFSFILYELSKAPDVQTALRQEIAMSGIDFDKLTYEEVYSLPLLDMVVNESARLHSPLQFLSRLCTQDITLSQEGREYKLKKGMIVIVPVHALHTDAEYFPEPYKFKPERFSDENKGSINKFSFLPFGEGPRICLGSRYAVTQIKVAIIALIRHFEILPATSHETVPVSDPYNSFVHTFHSGIWLRFNKIKDC